MRHRPKARATTGVLEIGIAFDAALPPSWPLDFLSSSTSSIAESSILCSETIAVGNFIIDSQAGYPRKYCGSRFPLTASLAPGGAT